MSYLGNLTADSTFKCPCGYEFRQKDDYNFRRLTMVKKLHLKKCKKAQESWNNRESSFTRAELDHCFNLKHQWTINDNEFYDIDGIPKDKCGIKVLK